MAKINILPAKVYNRIAAGEVVDRPYSVVKELVENAIDAGATEIEIHIENGGKQLIRVVDNGCGIERDDLQSAFLPHATSKIAAAEDLENIVTLGFRGEAIASIAAVSKMTITSRTENGKCYSLSSNGGELGSVQEASGDKGTEVRVEMLFFNAPVRLNFLKSDKAEEADITTFVSRFILNRSNIAFTYYANGKKILQSFGGGDEEALVCVYGASTRAQCIQIDGERHGIRVRGFIGNQNFYKANKSYQSVFLNGRYILNATVSAAISGAYANYLMKRQYPFYVLHISVPPQIVDVNVHPNKADVRFADNQIIYGCIHKIIASVLDGNAQALSYVVAEKEEVLQEEILPQIEKKSLSEDILSKVEDSIKKVETTATPVFETGKTKTFGFATLNFEDAQKEIESCAPFFDPSKKHLKNQSEEEDDFFKKYADKIIPYDQAPEIKPEDMQIFNELAKPDKNKSNIRKLSKHLPELKYQTEALLAQDEAMKRAKLRAEERAREEYERARAKELDAFEENKRWLEELDKKAKQRKIDVATLVYVGKVFNTYLLYECQDSVFLIDQHAAHERLIFDRLKEKMKNREVVRQPMLLPYELNVNALEAAFLRANKEVLLDIGFEMEESKDGCFSVLSVPSDLQNIQLQTFFSTVLSDLGNYHTLKLEDMLKDRLASAACKAAVKGGMDISKDQIDELLKQMDGDMGLKCPHGRPVVVELSKTEIEKMFKRIV